MRSESSQRLHALALVRRTVRSGKATKEQIATWTDELGPEVTTIVEQETPKAPKKRAATSSKTATSGE